MQSSNLPTTQPVIPTIQYRFSGHETFPCRYAWLPKAFAAVKADPHLLSDDDKAMVELGVGKNMVRAARFWVQVYGIANAGKLGTLATTDFGERILSPQGLDPFLEDIRTLWLLHWKLSTIVDQPLFAWHFLLNHWQFPEISRVAVLEAFQREATRQGRRLSVVTLEQHLDVFLHTYVPTIGRKGDVQEDNLDSPFVELNLLQRVGERQSDGGGRREPIYAFQRDSKPEIGAALFTWCVNDFFESRHTHETTLSFQQIASGVGSPGQILKLPERDLHDRLTGIEEASNGAFTYSESAARHQIIRNSVKERDLLGAIYREATR